MKENTRQKLIDATFEEIYSHGYQGTALADVLSNAGVHKGSMYHFFENKKDMAITAINEKMNERFFVKYGQILNLTNNFLDEFFKSLKDISSRDFKRGCPIANIVQEMSNLDEDFNKTMKFIYEEFKRFIQDILDKAVDAKEMQKCDTKKIALFITATLEGAILAAKASGNPQDYVDSIDLLEEYIQKVYKID